MQMTSEAIKTAAAQFNAEYPESLAEIAGGEAVIWVFCEYRGTGAYGGGKSQINAVVHAGIRTADGSFISAGEPDAHWFAVRDGRENPAANARRAMRARWNGVHVPIEYTAEYPAGTVIRDEPGPDGKPARKTRKAAAA